MKRLLFVCSQNKLRSPTAEAVFADTAGLSVRSAGLKNEAEIVISVEDIIWADYIFVMEPTHKKKIQQRFRVQLTHQKLICLGIPDNYEYMEPALITLLEQKVLPYIG